MTDLAQKIAALLVDKGYVMQHEQHESAYAIRTALPVARGEAVARDAAEAVSEVMEQAQVFASTWATVGGRFDLGHAMDDAKEAKEELRRMVQSLATLAAAPTAPRIAELEREVERLREAVRGMLRTYHDTQCSALHHKKADQHEIGEPCPVVARRNAALDNAEAALAAQEKNDE